MLVLILLLGCPKSRVLRDDVILSALERADAAWEARSATGLDPVGRALDEAALVAPDHPGVAWRRARLEVSRGLIAEERGEAVVHYGAAREAGWACVLADPRVEALRVEVGIEEALAEVPVERRPCTAWTALAWVRWTIAFGPEAAALDSPLIDALLAAPQPGLEHAGTITWARALFAGTRAIGERDLSTARASLSELSRRLEDPTEGVALLDLYALFDRGTDRDERTKALVTTKRPASIEARAYRQRILNP